MLEVGGVSWPVLMDTESTLVPQQLASSPVEPNCQADGVSLAPAVKTSWWSPNKCFHPCVCFVFDLLSGSS